MWNCIPNTNPDPDPGQPNEYGSRCIQIQIHNTGLNQFICFLVEWQKNVEFYFWMLLLKFDVVLVAVLKWVLWIPWLAKI
jgi:hypothetical protein